MRLSRVSESLPIRIEAGQAAAERWTAQLKDIATVAQFSFEGLEQSNGKPVKDLNDLLKIAGDSYRRHAKVIDVVMSCDGYGVVLATL